MLKVFCSICAKELKNCSCNREMTLETKVIEPTEIKKTRKKKEE